MFRVRRGSGGLGGGGVGLTAATWPWFVLMDEVLGQRHSTPPTPILITSIPEDTPGPSAAVDDQEEEEEECQPVV